MSTNKTEHYALHAWEPGDDFLRTEFNENFAAVDAVLGEMPANKKLKLVTGTYTGDGKVNQTISLAFAPKVMIVACRDSGSYYHVSLVLPNADTMYASLDGEELTVNGYLNFAPGDNGSAGYNCNPYRYIAFDWED